MTLAASEHPAKVETYEVKQRRGFEAAALFGSVAFVACGLWMMLDDTTDFAQKAAGLLGVAFFGWCAVVIVRRMRGGAGILLSRKGLHYAFAPHYKLRKLIPWADIEAFAVSNVEGNEFNLIRLASTGALLGQFSEAEEAETVQVYRNVMRMGGATAVIAGANLKFGKAIKAASLLRGSGTVVSLGEMLNFSRQKFGGEICLGWPDRDRSAAAFNELLATWRDHHGRLREVARPAPVAVPARAPRRMVQRAARVAS